MSSGKPKNQMGNEAGITRHIKSYGLPWTLSGHSTEGVGSNNGIDKGLELCCVLRKKNKMGLENE